MPPSRTDQQPARRRAAAAASIDSATPAPAPDSAPHHPGRLPYALGGSAGLSSRGSSRGGSNPDLNPAGSSAAGPAGATNAANPPASGLAAAVPQGLWRLVDAVKRQQRRLEADRRHEGGERQRARAAPKRETSSDEELAIVGSPVVAVVELASSAEFAGPANGASHIQEQLLGSVAGAPGIEVPDGSDGNGARRVAFETTVRTNSGGSLPLRTESATERSNFVRGVGPVYRSMDGLRQYTAPWGYQLVERLTPHGRGFSLAVRARRAAGPGRFCCECTGQESLAEVKLPVFVAQSCLPARWVTMIWPCLSVYLSAAHLW